VVASGASGAWAGRTNNIAYWTTQNFAAPTWDFWAPSRGWVVFNLADSLFHYFNGSTWVAQSSSGTVTTYIPLENGAPDQTGNSFYSIAALSNYFYGHWEYVKGAASYINFAVRIPNTVAATPNASIVLEICSADGTAGHTANFTTSDAVITASASFNVGALSSAAAQTYTTTSTAYARVTKTFAVQSTVAANNILVVKIATSTTGTAPTSNMLVLPYLKIDQTL
jgi:hypothetical protein